MAQLGDFRTRVLTASIIGPAALLCIWWGGYWWSGLILFCMAGLGWEWVRLCGGSSRRMPGLLVPGVALLAATCAILGWPVLALVVLLAGASAAWAVAPSGGLPPFWLGFGVMYIGLAGVALLLLRHDPDAGRDNVVFLFLVIWASDISAYLAGRSIGGPKLAPRISPNKTWSGSVGGLLGAISVGVVAAILIGSEVSAWQVALVAALLGLATQSGDMFESWIKRRFGVKDSSGLLPGHGGLLDRLDGVLAASPVAALIALIGGAGGHLWRWV